MSRPKLRGRRLASPEVPEEGGLKTPDVSYVSKRTMEVAAPAHKLTFGVN